jgi:hypothetical protein
MWGSALKANGYRELWPLEGLFARPRVELLAQGFPRPTPHRDHRSLLSHHHRVETGGFAA